ncbi:MAG: alpha/beta fold hydrolase [Propionibacteriaceae bacterium]
MESFRRSGYLFDVHDSGGSGAETVVLLHGFPQQPVAFKHVLPPLQAAGLRTLVPSQRGYTASARPKARRHYRSDETVADVIALLDAAGVERVHLVGHDWGGFQAWGVAAWHPDRVASLTVLSTPHPSAMRESFTSSNQALRSLYMALFQLPLLPEAFAQATLARTLRNTDLPLEYIGHYSDIMAERAALTGALNWYRGIPFSRRSVGAVTVPTTYVWGAHDFALGRTAAERTEKYVHAPYEFRELDAGHWLPETHPDAVAEAVLDRVRG